VSYVLATRQTFESYSQDSFIFPALGKLGAEVKPLHNQDSTNAYHIQDSTVRPEVTDSNRKLEFSIVGRDHKAVSDMIVALCQSAGIKKENISYKTLSEVSR
jgi:hypothetical protein